MKKSFDFALTTYCQAKCRSCERTNESTGEKVDWLKLQHMKFDTFKRVIDEGNFEEKLRYIQFCGELGDPMMHPEVSKFVDYSFRVADRVHINTNGGLRHPDWYRDWALDGRRLRIKFGIDGTDHDTNWKYREGVNWQRAMDNMNAWFTNGGRGAWHFLIFEWNWHQIPLAQQMADDIGCEIEFKFNNRTWGLISEENRKTAVELINEVQN